MKNICKKTLVISIILLFVGVSVSSGISIDNKPNISKVENEEDCGCKGKTDSTLCNILWKMIASLGFRINIIYVFYDILGRNEILLALLQIYIKTLIIRMFGYIIIGEILRCDWPLPEPDKVIR